MMRYLVLVLVLLSLILTACGEKVPDGALVGDIDFFPFAPVATENGEPLSPEIETFLTRTVVVRDAAGKEAASAEVVLPGRYEFSLPPGNYTIEVELVGIEFSKEMPGQVVISSDQTTEYDIMIDTGIR